MSDSSLKQDVESSPSTSYPEDPDCSSRICSDDDDEFGNFEEASVSCTFEKNTKLSQSGSIDKCDFAENFRRNSDTSSLTARLPKLFELVGDSNLWNHEDCTEPNEAEEHFICDLFRKFDFCDSESTSGTNITKRDSKSLNLWSKLCYVEDTAALNFLWNNSVAYLNFLHSLKMNVNKFGDHSVLMKKADFAMSANSAASGSGVFVKRDISNSGISSELVDSLSVPPVSFDWQTSGLSNPLTGSSMPAISAVLQCDFFNGDGPQNSQCNGQSILQKELDALGLNENTSTIAIVRSLSNLDELLEKSCGVESGFKNSITESNHLTSKIDNNKQQNEENIHHNPASKQPIKLKSMCDSTDEASHMRERLSTGHNHIIGSRLASPIKNE